MATRIPHPSLGDFPVVASRQITAKRTAKYFFAPIALFVGAINAPLYLAGENDAFDYLSTVFFPAYFIGLGLVMHQYYKKQQKDMQDTLGKLSGEDTFGNRRYFVARRFYKRPADEVLSKLCQNLEREGFGTIKGTRHIAGIKLMTVVEAKVYEMQDNSSCVDLLRVGWSARKGGEDLLARLGK